MEPAPLLERTAQPLFDHSLFNGHPRFFDYITSPPAPIGILGDLLAAAVNPNVGAWTLSPAATELESQTVRWIAALIGYPVECGGLLVSGGNMANLVCSMAARAACTAKIDGNVRENGIAGKSTRRLRVYVSSETHTWIQKAADLAGLGTASIRWIPTDADLRMDVAALRRQIDADGAAGDSPCLVVGTAGSVSAGAVDPLRDISAICKEHGIWFHVDGAYGGFAAALPEVSDDLHALSVADSVAVDPHKWLYAPLEAGCASVCPPRSSRSRGRSGRRSSGRAASRCVQSRAGRSPAARRRGVCVEHGGRRPLPLARLHCELSHRSRRCGGVAGDRRATGTNRGR
jgi:aromatic-L-amino-acid decarboxylase